jgi:hypothetical protein
MITMEALLVLLIVVLFIIGLVLGGIQTFQRHWIVALLLLLFFTPIWICWALIENFLPTPVKKPFDITVTHRYK